MPHKTPLWSIIAHEMLSVVAIRSLITHLRTTKLTFLSLIKFFTNKIKRAN
jgi:hypothetical protein